MCMRYLIYIYIYIYLYIYAKILQGEPFPINTGEHWRELANKHHACDVKGADKLPYAKTMVFPILEVHQLEVPLPFIWKQGWVGCGKFNVLSTSEQQVKRVFTVKRTQPKAKNRV